ncbi:hypothetical protein Tco_1292716 [Tanacetum coccineum]
MENEHELSYETLTRVYLGSYEHYKSVVSVVEYLEPGFELQGAKMVEIGLRKKRCGASLNELSKDGSDIGSPGVAGPPIMPEDPYAYIMDAYEVPPSPDYIPGPEIPPSPDYIPGSEESQSPPPLDFPPSPDYIPGPEEPQSPPPLDFVPEPMYPEYMPQEDEILPAEEQPLPATAASPTIDSPGYVPESDPEEEPEEDDEDPEEDPADYPADGDDDDDEDEDEDEDEEEEEHPAPADSVPPVHRMTARISIRDEPSISLPPREEVERLLALTTPPPSPLTPLSSPLPQIPSPPLPIPSPPPNSPTHIEIPESCLPLRKRVRFASPTPSHEVGESSAAGAARQDRPAIARDDPYSIAREDLYGFVDMVDVPPRCSTSRELDYDITDTWDDLVGAIDEIAPTTIEGVNQRVTDLATIVEEETTSMYGIMEDAQDDRSQLRGRVNMLYRDRPVHRHLEVMIEREAKMAQCIDFKVTISRSQETEGDYRGYRHSRLARVSEAAWTRKRSSTAVQPGEAVYKQLLDLVYILTQYRSFVQHVDAYWNGDVSHTSEEGVKKACAGLLTTSPEAAHAMPWRTLKKMMTDKYYPRGEIKKLEFEMWNLKTKLRNMSVACRTTRSWQVVMATKPKTMRMPLWFRTDSWKKRSTPWADVWMTTKESDDTARIQPEESANPNKETKTLERAYAPGNGVMIGPPQMNTEANQRGSLVLNVVLTGHFQEDFIEIEEQQQPVRTCRRGVKPPSTSGVFESILVSGVGGAAPVARTPYRLAPSEMKELAKQLQELTDSKGILKTDSEETATHSHGS